MTEREMDNKIIERNQKSANDFWEYVKEESKDMYQAMSAIQFDQSLFENEMDKANAIYSYIVNRAYPFSDHYTKIMVEGLEDSPKGLVIYNIFTILGTLRDVEVYVKGKKPSFWNSKNKIIKKVWSKRKWEKMLDNDDVLMYNFYTIGDKYEPSPHPLLFKGITREQIEYIAKELFNWQR